MNRLRSCAAIEAKHPAEPLEALDWSDRRLVAATLLDQSIVEPLMISLRVVMSRELASSLPKRSFSEEDHSVEALFLDRSDESLGVGVQIRRSMRQADHLNTGVLQQVPERQSELGISIENQVLLPGQESVDGVSEVPADLHHPCFVRTRRDPGNLDLARLQLDYEEDIERDQTTQ